MDRESIHSFVKEVAGPSTELIDHDRWVSFRCILAPWTHEKGMDSTPSAGISINDDGTSVYNCYACATKHRSGPLVWLLRELEKYTGDSYRALIKGIEGGELFGGTLPEWGVRKQTTRKTLNILEPEYLDMFDSAAGHPYLRGRGITDTTVEYIGLKLDPEDSKGAERIVFPVYSPLGELAGFTGRATKDTVDPKVRDYYGLQKELVLLGSHQIDTTDPYVVLVEGLFDYARLVQAGYPAVACMHAGLTSYQLRILLDIGKPIVQLFDNDAAGIAAQDATADALLPYLPVSRCVYPKKRIRLVGGKWEIPKDPAAMLDGDIDRMLDRTRIV